MRSFVSIKVLRLLLALCVSLWMAGVGCVLGCSNNGVLASSSQGHMGHDSSKTVESAKSCHSARSHDCCARRKAANSAAPLSTPPESLLAMGEALAGMMKDCPLAVNASAVASKISGDASDPGETPGSSLPQFESKAEHSEARSVPPYDPTAVRPICSIVPS
jgi:hypothetical protein